MLVYETLFVHLNCVTVLCNQYEYGGKYGVYLRHRPVIVSLLLTCVFQMRYPTPGQTHRSLLAVVVM